MLGRKIEEAEAYRIGAKRANNYIEIEKETIEHVGKVLIFEGDTLVRFADALMDATSSQIIFFSAETEPRDDFGYGPIAEGACAALAQIALKYKCFTDAIHDDEYLRETKRSRCKLIVDFSRPMHEGMKRLSRSL